MGAFLWLTSIVLTPSFCRKNIGLFLSHLVPERHGLIVEPIFHQMYCLADFKHFVPIFILIFDRFLLDPSIYKILDPLVPMLWYAEPRAKIE